MRAAVLPDTADPVLAEIDAARRSGPLQQIVIPPCPELLTRLQQAMLRAEPDLNEVARIAASDVAMSATLIRSANSPLYAAGQPAQTIGQAMNRLGLEHTARVMTGFLMQGAIKVPNSPHLQRFWERATKRATAMSFMAGHLPGMSADVAYTYGLFCHVGMVVMAQSVRGYLSTMVEARARIDRSYVATENANHRTDHAVVGALTARVWRLSPAVVAAIRLHHDLDTLAERSAQSEVSTLIALGLVAEYLMRRHEGLDPDVDWHQHGATALAWLQLGADDVLAWEEDLRVQLDGL
ncbi:HDOD domain-containing protein [uncultured Aquabacterium sp.]|jgi:HD-like signal output (HDOD) protein|uniref:HDOD domain-containing protein n=1 Tax=uncultured Aquabacterium sp. TaxID=158753 RepID=UPI0026237C2B|nr:HDOD domain-containing protein [uncultured Aquabacterium sp.]